MSNNDLIVNLIHDARNYLERAKVAKDRDRDMDRAFKASTAASGRLLEAVLMQQRQIETQREIIRTLEADVCKLIQARRGECDHPGVINDRCAGCGAPWSEVGR